MMTRPWHFRGVCRSQLLSRLLETLFKLCSAPASPEACSAQPCYIGLYQHHSA